MFCFRRLQFVLAAVICASLFVSTQQAAIADQPGRARRPNILFLLSDDQRPDTIGALGNEHIQTPNLDWLAKNGTVFTRAICANPICTPSRAEILTGVSGFRNGVLDFGRTIDPQLARWPQTMRDAGYHTWYVGKWHVRGRPSDHGYEDTLGLFSSGGGKWWKDQVDWKGYKVTGYRGWIFQTDAGEKFPERGVGLTPDISAMFADAAIKLIERKPDKPFFLQVSFTAPHDPLFMPPGYEGKYDSAKIPVPKNFAPRHPFDHGNLKGRDEVLLPFPRTKKIVRQNLAVYYAVISHMDAQIGRIIDSLKQTEQLDNTIIVFSSDHGLAVGSHGLRGKQNMYEHTIGVPLVFSGPGIARGQQRDAQCYLRDLFPTTCDLARVDIPKTVEGRSLKEVLQGRAKSVYPHVFGYFRDKQRMIRTDRWKLIHYPHIDRFQLFDLRNDPFELHDLVSDEQHGAVVASLRKKLRAWQESVRDPVIKDT